ncbi:outer membrane protein [Legionella busanensis]|uniref:Cell division coordinator CpoB n=1 Tax=Legionella busanensis TaxID=190655 RepID=A0A378JQQ6_9GAMM|nr:tol-pal system protein YbgF [Legionella busanensis]STX52509.1 outer membrane protein [Legionella busanensis]
MIRSPKGFLIICFTCLLPLSALAEAPVVDDSENFAIFDDGQAAIEQPVAKAQLEDNDAEIALAQDNELNADSTNVELLDKLKSLQQELQELRGQLEVQAHNLKTLQEQQLTFYQDINTRLKSTNPAATSAATKIINSMKRATEPSIDEVGTKKAETPAVKPYSEKQTKAKLEFKGSLTAANKNPADEQISYLAAYDLVKNKQFDDALSAMQNFVTRYPQGGYTANAHYWLGELYMVKKNYASAIEHFETVLTRFPTSSKTAACLLKIGYALAASGQEIEARQRLQEVVKNYPDTPTAELAAAKLKSISTL